MVTTLLKRLIQVSIALVLMIVVAMASIATFVNPNDFKETIQRQALEHTGHALVITGPLSWEWLPILSLQIENVALNSIPPLTDPLASAKQIKAECSLWSLLSGKVLLNLQIDGLNLHLQKTASGQANWTALQARFTSPKTAASTEKSALTTSTEAPKEPMIQFQVLLNHVSVKNSTITLSDNQNNTQYHITQLTVSADSLSKALLGATNAVSIDFNLQSKQASLGHIALKGSWSINTGLDQLNIQNVSLTHLLQDGKPNLLTADAKISNLTRSPVIEGKFSGTALEVENLKIDQITGTILAKNGILDINPLTLKIAQSLQNLSLKIDLTGSVPKYAVTQEAKDFEINHLLTLLGKPNTLEGRTNLKTALTVSGNTPSEWRNSLSGNVDVEIVNGKIHGLDLSSHLSAAMTTIYSVIDRVAHKQIFDLPSVLSGTAAQWKIEPSEYTAFHLAQGNATIKDGAINNSKLSVTHPDYTLQGSGTINLATEVIAYNTFVLLHRTPYPAVNSITQFLSKTPLAIQIQGTLNSPSVRPDVDAYTQNALKNLQQNLLQTFIEQGTHKVLEHILPPGS